MCISGHRRYDGGPAENSSVAAAGRGLAWEKRQTTSPPSRASPSYTNPAFWRTRFDAFRSGSVPER
jgi:hypothetical protein